MALDNTSLIIFQCNPTVTNLDIEGGHIGPEGIAYLSNIIYVYDILIKLISNIYLRQTSGGSRIS